MARHRTLTALAGGTAILAGAALAVGDAGGAPQAGVPQANAAKLPHSLCYRALTKRGQHRVSRQEAQRILRGGDKVIRRTCKLPGTVGVNGRPGANGPAGPPGPAGANATNAAPHQLNIPVTIVPFATGFMVDGGNVQPLAQVGPIHVDGLCRRTFSPGTGGSKYPNPHVLPSSGGESEAQVIVWTETGSMTMKGGHGHRENVPPGPPDYSQATGTSPNQGKHNKSKGTDQAHSPEPNGPVAPVSDPVAGEGQHLFLAASNETNDEVRATDPASDNPNDPAVRQLGEYPGFNVTDGIVTTSEGHIIQGSMLAGFDVLGVYGACVFSGTFDVIS